MLRIWKRFVIMSTFLLTLVRHGETAENKLKIVQGHTDTKLVERGVQQAVLVGQRLANEAFTHVFSSDLSRALETCEIIMSRNRADSAPITLDSRLRERKLGVLEGQSHLNCQKSIKTSKKNLLPGMETKTEVRERAKSFFRELCRTICKGSSKPSNNETSNTSNFQCPCCKSQDCKCCSSSAALPPIPRPLGSERGPSRVLLCNAGECSSRMSKHLKNGAAPALENSRARMSLSLESSSDEEHLGITPDVLQLGRQLRPGGRDPAEGVPEDRGSALNENLLWGKYGSCEGLQNEGQQEESRSTERPEDEGDQSQQLANVLLVSHGGFLLELINYFFKELKCKSPLNPKTTEAAEVPTQAIDVEHSRHSIMSNAGLSRFAISINTKLAKPTTVTCLYLNDRKHLLGEFEEEEDPVAGSDIVC